MKDVRIGIVLFFYFYVGDKCQKLNWKSFLEELSEKSHPIDSSGCCYTI
jgi:hypothetical protein